MPVIPLPGGFQPRAAVGYALVAALEAAALCGAAPSLRDEVEAAAALAEELAAEWGPDGAEDSRGEGARARAARHGPGDRRAPSLTAPVAYRWKCQINENAGLPAFASGCRSSTTTRSSAGRPRELGRFSAVFLEDPGAHPRDAPAHRADRRAGRARAPPSSSA